MPIYEYKCSECNKIFEYIQKFSDKPKEKCTNCGGKLSKIVSQSAIKFKGSGWFVTDYGKSRAREATGTTDKEDNSTSAKTKSSAEDKSNSSSAE